MSTGPDPRRTEELRRLIAAASVEEILLALAARFPLSARPLRDCLRVTLRLPLPEAPPGPPRPSRRRDEPDDDPFGLLTRGRRK